MEKNENITPKKVAFKNVTATKVINTSKGSVLVELSDVAVKKEPKKNPRLNAVAVSDENFDKVKLDRGVTVLLVKDPDVDYTKIKTLQDVLDLDAIKPGNIADFRPPLFIDYIDRANATIRTYVKIDDIVTVNRKYVDTKGDVPRRVIDLYFKSLNNMTVIMAKLEDDDINLTNRLIVCK